MNIEPLQTILSFTDNKKDTLLYYLDKNVSRKVIDFDYEDDGETLYINEKIIGIKKNTLAFDFIGNIICIDEDILTIKLNNIRSININRSDYYIFIKYKKDILKKKDFMKQLLEQL